MKNILFIIIIGLIIGLIYTNRVEGFKNINSSLNYNKNWFFPGTTLADIKPLEIIYNYNWVTHTPVTIDADEEKKNNPDVMYISGFGYLDEINKSKSSLPYKPMNASKLYENKFRQFNI
jgi:hypothetical protein